MLPLFKACQEIHGEVIAEKLVRAVSVEVNAECPFTGCVWALSFHMVALVMLGAMCCYLYACCFFLSQNIWVTWRRTLLCGALEQLAVL